MFSAPLTSLRQLPSISWGCRMRANLWVRDCRRMMPKAKASNAAPASPAPQPHRAAGPLATHLLSGCKFAHTKNSSGRVCTRITSQYSVQTEQGFERPSAQGELQSGRRRLRASRARGDPADSSLPAGASGSTCVGASDEPVDSSRGTFQVHRGLSEAGCVFLSVLSVSSQSCA